MKHITVGTGFEWQSKWAKVGIHSIVEHLLKHECKVDWFMHPISLWYFAKLKNLDWKIDRLKQSLIGTQIYKFDRSTLACHATLALFHPVKWFSIFNGDFAAKNCWTFATIGFPPRRLIPPKTDLLLFDSGGVSMFPAFAPKAKLVVHRLNDLVAEFLETSDGVARIEQDVIRNADVILPVSTALYDQVVHMRGSAEGVYLLPNGVNVEMFLEDHDEPQEYLAIPQPRAIFVGTLSSWLDWDLLTEVAKKRPEISFCIIGGGQAPSTINSLANIYLLGKRSYHEIPPYLQHADVGLIPFKDMPRIRKVEMPLKFYQYIASGLPVVTVSHGSMAKMSPPALLANTPNDFAHALDQALTYTPQQRSELRAFAQKFSWRHVFTQLDQILTRYGFNTSVQQ